MKAMNTPITNARGDNNHMSRHTIIFCAPNTGAIQVCLSSDIEPVFGVYIKGYGELGIQ